MNKTVLNKCITGLNLTSDSLVGFYSFGEYSGRITFNEKLDSPRSDSFSDGNLQSDTYPLYNLCDTKDVNVISGSGYFDSDTVLQAGESFPHLDWTVFIEYESNDFYGVSASLGRTLFSTMQSPSSTSGLSFGLNGANKPYSEYKNKDGIKKVFTLNTELGKRNILSFSYSFSNNQIGMTHHDFLYDNTKSKNVDTLDSVDASGVNKIYSDDAFYIGDFYSSDSNYTGFSGHVNNIIIFKEFLSSGSRDLIAKSIIGSDYSGQRQEEQTVYSTGITTHSVSNTGVTGSGITGYETISSGEILSRCGSDFSGFAESGIVGGLIGSFFTFTTGTTLISGVQYVHMPEQVFIDEARKLEFKRTALVSLFPFDSGIDTSEIYCYTGLDSDLNNVASPKSNIQAFDLGTGYTGQNFAFYRNGIFQKSGVYDGSQIQSGDFYVSGADKIVLTGTINEDGQLDANVYDLIDEDIFFTDYQSGEGNLFLAGQTGKDVYLNGKKLIILHNYNEIVSGGNPYTVIDRDTLNFTQTGELAFVPKKAFDVRLLEPDGQNSIEYNSNGFVTEIMWFNGQRQKRNENYLIISENSLLNTGEFVRYNDNFSLYEGEDYGVETY
jgi:hypothetical protein